jgi:hypothetical protein
LPARDRELELMPAAATDTAVKPKRVVPATRRTPGAPDPPKRRGGHPTKAELAALPPYDLDFVTGKLRDGEDLTEVARLLKRTRFSLRDWIANDPVRVAAVAEARREAAHAYVEKAGAVLRGLPAGATPAQIAQARELAHHYRWCASKSMPKVYGDKVEVEGHVTVDPLTVLVQQIQTTGSRIPLRGVDQSITDIEPKALPAPDEGDDA